jgi:hypothetical protein
MGYDSRDGKGERTIWDVEDNYHRPLITPDGEQIVYSNRQKRKIYVIKWDGSPPRLLKEPGCASEVWRDPKTGRTWIYFQEDPDNYAKPVLRFPIDSPEKVEKSWSGPSVAIVPAFPRRQDGSFHVPLANFRRGAAPGRNLAQASRWLLAFDGTGRQLYVLDVRRTASKLVHDASGR